MTINFDVAFTYLIGNEGRTYTNDPNDFGGPTKFGITKRTYQDFFARMVIDSEIENMSEATAKQIYAALYWGRLRCGDIQNLGIAICIFDSAVLYGNSTSALLAQESLVQCGASIKFDGVLGDKSIESINVVSGAAFINAFNGLVLERIDTVIAAHPSDEKYRTGWTRRANRLLSLLDNGFLNQLKGES